MPSDEDYEDMAKGREKVQGECPYCGMKFYTVDAIDEHICHTAKRMIFEE